MFGLNFVFLIKQLGTLMIAHLRQSCLRFKR